MLLNRPPFDLDFSIVLSLTGGEGGRGSGSMCMNTEVARMLRSLWDDVLVTSQAWSGDQRAGDEKHSIMSGSKAAAWGKETLSIMADCNEDDDADDDDDNTNRD